MRKRLTEPVILMVVANNATIEIPLTRQLAVNCLNQFSAYCSTQGTDKRYLRIDSKDPNELDIYDPRAHFDLGQVAVMVIKEVYHAQSEAEGEQTQGSSGREPEQGSNVGGGL